MKRCRQFAHIVTLRHVFEIESKVILCMEVCTGGDIQSRLASKGAFTEAAARKICFDLASAIRHIHSQGIVHRDLKPENVLFSAEDGVEVRVCDFGLAHVGHQAKAMRMLEDTANIKRDGIMRTAVGSRIFAGGKLRHGDMETWRHGDIELIHI